MQNPKPENRKRAAERARLAEIFRIKNSPVSVLGDRGGSSVRRKIRQAEWNYVTGENDEPR